MLSRIDRGVVGNDTKERATAISPWCGTRAQRKADETLEQKHGLIWSSFVPWTDGPNAKMAPSQCRHIRHLMQQDGSGAKHRVISVVQQCEASFLPLAGTQRAICKKLNKWLAAFR